MNLSMALSTATVISAYVLCIFVGAMATKLLVLMWKDEIDLRELISESSGEASMSRLQLLIFTFVIAISLFYLVLQNHAFPWISDGVLTLLGISASTYAVGKGISYSQPQLLAKPDGPAAVAAARAAGAEAGAAAGAPAGAMAGAVVGAPAGAAAGAAAGAPAGAVAGAVMGAAVAEAQNPPPADQNQPQG